MDLGIVVMPHRLLGRRQTIDETQLATLFGTGALDRVRVARLRVHDDSVEIEHQGAGGHGRPL